MNWFTWALLSAFFAGLTAVLAKVGVNDVHSNVATAIRTTVIVVFSWGIATFSLKAGDLAQITSRTWTFLTLSGLATGLSWLCYFRALQIGTVSQVAPIDKLSVVVAILISVAALGEKLGTREICAVALIVSGSILLAWK